MFTQLNDSELWSCPLQDTDLPGEKGSQHVSTDHTRTQGDDGNDVSKKGEGHGVVTEDVTDKGGTVGGSDKGDTEGTDIATGVASKEKDVALNSDDVCTQAYGKEEGVRGNSSKGRSVINSDDVSTQAYGEEGVTDYPKKKGRITTNSDDVSTQAYCQEGVTDYPNKRKGIADNSDDISTQAYCQEEVTDYPNKRKGIADNSDDISTQAYGEEGVTHDPSKGGCVDANSDDVCTQAYTREEPVPLRSSPWKRQGRERAVPSECNLFPKDLELTIFLVA